MTTLIAARV